MKRKILLILNMAIIGFSTAACSDDEPNNDGGNTDIEEVVPGTITSLRKRNIRSLLLP